MLSTDVFLIINSIAMLSLFIAVYVSLKHIEKRAKTLVFEAIAGSIPFIKDLAEQWLNSEKGQKAIMQIGGLIGNGAKIGFGFQGRGKNSITGLLTEVVSGFIQQKAQQALGQPEQQQQPGQLPSA